MGLKRRNSKKEEFNRILLEAIDETLDVLGESVKKTLLYYLKRDYSIEEKEIPKNFENFISTLRDIFGEAGTAFLERRIVEALYRRLGIPVPINLSFEEGIEEAIKLYVEK